MTSTIPQPPVIRRTPTTVTTVRVLVVVQAVVAFVGSAMVGLIAAFGLGLSVEGRTDKLTLAVGLAALTAGMIAFAIGLLLTAGRLRHGRESARLVLIALQAALLVGVLLLTRGVGGALDFSGFPAPSLVLGVSAVAALISLVAQPTRRWCA